MMLLLSNSKSPDLVVKAARRYNADASMEGNTDSVDQTSMEANTNLINRKVDLSYSMAASTKSYMVYT